LRSSDAETLPRCSVHCHTPDGSLTPDTRALQIVTGVGVLAATAICGTLQAVAGGQPLLIVGVAEPIVLTYQVLAHVDCSVPAFPTLHSPTSCCDRPTTVCSSPVHRSQSFGNRRKLSRHSNLCTSPALLNIAPEC